MVNTDVVVIGAGVMGASIALDLARSGRKVVVLDKGDAVGGGSTSASSSVVRTNYSTLEGVTASWEATHVWKSFGDHVGQIDGPIARLVTTGMLMFDPPGADRSATLGHFVTAGVPHEVVGAADIPARFPFLDHSRFWPPKTAADPAFFDPPDGELEVLWMPEGGFIDDPQLAATNMMDAAKREGAVVRLRTAVTSIDTVDGAVTAVHTSDGDTIHAACVVNAGGPWSSHINELVDGDLGMQVGTRPLRQEVHTLMAPDTFTPEGGGSVVGDMDLGTYFRPHFGGTIIVGGVEADCDPLDWLDDADDYNPSPTTELFESQTFRVARRIPGAEVPLRPRGLASAYDVTPDWVPTYDRTDVDGYYVAIGTSGNQFKNAPIVGGIVRSIIDQCEAGRNHDDEPAQYDCTHTGHTLDLSHYSRRRSLNNTTGTVLG